jgi:superfamily II DNA or RNA helicase
MQFEKGGKMTKLRPWQEQALAKAENWLLGERKDKHFLINAAPGAGKTIAACAIAKRLIQRGEIDRVIVIAPRSEVVNQWGNDFYLVLGRHMSKVTARDGDIQALGLDVCATWSAVQGLEDAFQSICRSSRTLVICDEHHHAAVNAAWGDGANGAFADAKFVLVLTGTPIRSDGSQTVWLAYDDHGAIDHPEAGSYTLTYGEAVDLGYCRPVTFHRHQGRFTVDLEGGEKINVAGDKPGVLPKDLARIPGLQTVINFYRLACTPQYESDGETPLKIGYQATMLEWGIQKLDELRQRLPEAGGLVIAPSIEMADYFAKLIELVDGETPIVVHSQTPNAENKIKAFRNTTKRWLVSVAMVSEGVDIPRLRVLLYLPSAFTELAFRQAIGRAVRSMGPEDDTRAYVVMPAFETFEHYARRVEEEMSPAARTEPKVTSKRCPACREECDLGAKECASCGYEFPAPKGRFKACEACDGLNPVTAKACQHCGKSFLQNFTLTLDEAMRTGAIVRGMDIGEEEVRTGEEIAPELRAGILRSGDAKLVHIIRTLPEESYARLVNILENGRRAKS